MHAMRLYALLGLCLAGAPAMAQYPEACNQSGIANPNPDSSRSRVPLLPAKQAQAWARRLSDSIEAIQETTPEDSKVRDRFIRAVRAMVRRRRAETQAGLAFLVSDAPVAEPWVSDAAIHAYYEVFGQAYPILHFVETRAAYFSRLNALRAIRATEDPAEEATVFSYACDAAWLVTQWNRSLGPHSILRYRPDEMEARLLLPQAYRLVSAAHRAVLDSMAPELFPGSGRAEFGGVIDSSPAPVRAEAGSLLRLSEEEKVTEAASAEIDAMVQPVDVPFGPASFTLKRLPDDGDGVTVYRAFPHISDWHSFVVAIHDGRIVRLGGFNSPDVAGLAEILAHAGGDDDTEALLRRAQVAGRLLDRWVGHTCFPEGHVDGPCTAAVITAWKASMPREWSPDTLVTLAGGRRLVIESTISELEDGGSALEARQYAFVFGEHGSLLALRSLRMATFHSR